MSFAIQGLAAQIVSVAMLLLPLLVGFLAKSCPDLEQPVPNYRRVPAKS